MNNFKIYRKNGNIHFELSGSASIIAIVLLLPFFLIIFIYNLFMDKNADSPESTKKYPSEHPSLKPWDDAIYSGEKDYRLEWSNPYRTKFKGLPYYKKTISFTTATPEVSSSIEDDNGDFIGEWGATVKLVGQNLLPTVINVWLFDKIYFKETLNTYIISSNDNTELDILGKGGHNRIINLNKDQRSAVMNTKTLSMLIEVLEFSSSSQSKEMPYPKEIGSATIRVTIAPRSNIMVDIDNQVVLATKLPGDNADED